MIKLLRQSTFILFVVILQLAFCAVKAERLKEVVVLNSYHHGFRWTGDITDAIDEHFRDDETIRLFNEFMDSKRFNSDSYTLNLYKQYKLKYSNHRIDGVICSDNRAFDFFIEHGNEIWGDVPAVFCGVNNISELLNLINPKKHAIVHEAIDIKGTIALIEALQPELEEIIVISDETLSGNIFLDQFVTAFDSKKRNYIYRIINNTEPALLRQVLQNLDGKNQAIYLLSLYTQRNGIPNEMALESQYFFKDVNIPMYSNWDFLMPHLIVGGKILKAKDQGQLSAQLMKQFLMDEKTKLHSYPENHTIIDYTVLTNHYLDASLLPSNTEFINKNKSFIEQYKKELIIILAILIVFVFIITLLVSDIIKRKTLEINFIDSEKRLELAINGANEGLWDIDLNRNSIYINDQFAKLLGYNSSKEMMLNLHNWKSFIYSEDIEQVKEAYNQHQKGEAKAFKCETRLINCKGGLSWCSIHGKITEHLNGQPNRITGIILDINNQKDFENELHKAKEKAEESDRLKSSFLANMSHEIRTPMNAILGFADLLTYSELSPSEQHEYLNMIKRSGENLLTLINDIIDISKIESGELKINEDKININQLIKEVHIVGMSLCNNLNKQVELKLNKQTCKHAMIYTDPLRIYQILLNLVSNAVKFTDKGFIEIYYAVNQQNELILSVKDTGPGISSEDQKVIYDRFRQVDESTIKKHGGTGLGLSITKSLVGLMKGKIELDSSPSKGSTFTVLIPIKTHHEKAIM